MEIDYLSVLSVILGLVATIATGFWLKAKGKLGKLVYLFRQVVELVTKGFTLVESGVAMLDDNKIEQAEIDGLKLIFAELKKELNDVKIAFRDLLGREI